MFKPIEGAPGLFRVECTGEIINLEDFHPIETSDRFEGTTFNEITHVPIVILGWRFTCARWPANGAEVQQQVELSAGDQIVKKVSLSSLLTTVEPSVQRDSRGDPPNAAVLRVGIDRHLDMEKLGLVVHPAEIIRVVLQERPVEGAGLRIHFNMLTRIPTRWK